ncbi:MAG: radical SAM protein, partial [Desulfuromonadaceae bacterium]|nr:radical SAM protein [Desulfuromonadaceae bacterium]
MDNQQDTVVSRATKPFFSFYNLARFGFFLFGIPKNSFGSVDVTNRCNLRCDHCYFFEQDHSSEWSLEQWRDKFESLKAEGIRSFQCSWVGGEPLLRLSLVDLGRSYFKYNTVTTNGSLPLPDWKEVSWYISVDGSRDNHDKMRNLPGLYDTIKRNIAATEGLKITIAYCITRDNFSEISASLDEWDRNPKVRSMVFSFFTPVRGLDDSLWLGWDEKDRIIDLLLEKKKEYGNFIINSEPALKLMKSDKSRSVTDRCPFAEKSFALGPDGIAKEPCMLGPKADCDRCGCVVPFYLKSLTDRNYIVKDVVTTLKTQWNNLFLRR